MELDKYTERVKGFLQSAQTAALARGHQRLTPEHLLKVLLEDKEGLGANLIRAAGGDPVAALAALDAAREGKLDPVIGRDEEIRRTIQVLSRRTKNNPVLIGEPGVGKTAIVEGLALRIVQGDVPESLKDKRLMALDLGALVAGAKFRGEFEERPKAVLAEITAARGEIIAFTDEVPTLVGAPQAQDPLHPPHTPTPPPPPRRHH